MRPPNFLRQFSKLPGKFRRIFDRRQMNSPSSDSEPTVSTQGGDSKPIIGIVNSDGPLPVTQSASRGPTMPPSADQDASYSLSMGQGEILPVDKTRQHQPAQNTFLPPVSASEGQFVGENFSGPPEATGASQPNSRAQHSQKPSFAESEPNFDTASGPMGKLDEMDFEICGSDENWIPVKVMLDIGMDYSVLFRPIVDKHGFPDRPVLSKDIRTLKSPLSSALTTPSRYSSVWWRSKQLNRDPFKTDIYIIDTDEKDDLGFVAIFGRGVLQKKGLWDPLVKWMANENKKPLVAAPGIVVRRRGRDAETTNKDRVAWDKSQRSYNDILDGFEADATATTTTSSGKAGEDISDSSQNGETATTVSSGDVKKDQRNPSTTGGPKHEGGV